MNKPTPQPGDIWAWKNDIHEDTLVLLECIEPPGWCKPCTKWFKAFSLVDNKIKEWNFQEANMRMWSRLT